MSTTIKILLAVAAVLIVSGLILFTFLMMSNEWDFSKLSTEKYETNTYDIVDSFENIQIDTDTANITFALSDDAKSKVVCYEREKVYHSVSVSNGTLFIKTVDKRKWYDFIQIDFRSPTITVYLPYEELNSLSINEGTGDVKIPENFSFNNIDISASTGDVNCRASASEKLRIKLSTGNILLENVTAGSLDLAVSTGKIEISSIACEGDISLKVSTGKSVMENVSCKNLVSNGSTGDISLKNVIATEKFDIKRSTGDVRFVLCDAAEIYVRTGTGDVEGSFVSDKVVFATTDTGDVRIPHTTVGGRCEITTGTGNIIVTIS